MIIINPLEPMDQKKKFYLRMLLSHHRRVYLEAGEYRVKNQFINVQIHLTHALYRRPKEGNKKNLGYHIVNHEPSGEGQFGSIYRTLGVLATEKNLDFKETKPKIVKKIPFEKYGVFKSKRKDSNASPQEEKISHQQRKKAIHSITKEAKYTKHNPQLHCKKPSFDKSHGYIAMRYVGDMDLFDLVTSPYMVQLGPKSRTILTLNLLKALQRLHDSGLIHRDIKSENIRVNLKMLTAEIIDFASATKYRSYRRKSAISGTYWFLPPETLTRGDIYPESDVFSLGWALKELWGDASIAVLYDSLKGIPDLEKILEHHFAPTDNSLFAKMELGTKFREFMAGLLDKMCHPLVEQRAKLDDAIKFCELILTHYEELSTPENCGAMQP